MRIFYKYLHNLTISYWQDKQPTSMLTITLAFRSITQYQKASTQVCGISGF